jgi:hypothetical protein
VKQVFSELEGAFERATEKSEKDAGQHSGDAKDAGQATTA